MSGSEMPGPGNDPRGFLAGVRVIEIADELGEYAGKVLAGLGADVIKVEPPGGETTRAIGPFVGDDPDPENSLFFWHYDFGKRSVVMDLDDPAMRDAFATLVGGADIVLETRPDGYFATRGVDWGALRERHPGLITARISPFGPDGPWSKLQGSDLVHLALGGVVMNCGYDPAPDGTYDTPPIAPAMWHAYHVAGEMAVIGILGALLDRRWSGLGQHVETSVHQAVSASTETDLPDWIYQRLEHHRQTCRHSMPQVSLPALAMTKDGRWLLPYRSYLQAFGDSFAATVRLLQKYGMQVDLDDPKYASWDSRTSLATSIYVNAVTDRLVHQLPYAAEVWREAQAEGLSWAPIRRPEENSADRHWRRRETYIDLYHPAIGREVTHVGAKWYCPQVPWRSGPAAPRLGEHTADVLAEIAQQAVHGRTSPSTPLADSASARAGDFAIDGVRVVDLSWLLASGGAGRYLAALGADVIKVEHSSRWDAMRFGAAFAPDGGPIERAAATGPLTPEPGDNPNRSGMFMEINAGKRSISLNLKTAQGRELLTELLRDADIVLEGFSPGTMDRLGLGYEALREINPRLVYVQQSGMGQVGEYGRLRSYGPTAQAFTGISDMSGLPDPYPPAGIGYSYLDWYGAYNMVVAALSGLFRQRMTGQGCWIDSSQAEVGLYLTGTATLDHSVNGRSWRRYGNRSPYKSAAPHGVYPTGDGADRWLAISCFTEAHWRAVVEVLGLQEVDADGRFDGLADRLAHHDELDAHLATATCRWDGYELMMRLQERGVPAGVCQTAQDRCDRDPQLAAVGWMRPLPQSEIGTWPVREVPIHLSRTPARIGGRLGRHGPSYGEDNDDVFGQLLSVSEEELQRLALEATL